MICSKCGNRSISGERFCNVCGQPFIQIDNNINTNVLYTMPVQSSIKKTNTGLIIGIVSGIILFVVLVLYVSLFFFKTITKSGIGNPVAGEWNCKSYSGSGESADYIVKMKLNGDSTFIWAKYGDEAKNYVEGEYSYESLDKSNTNNEYQYYRLSLDGDKFIYDGEIQTDKYSSVYEMAIIKKDNNKQAIIINEYTHNMYSCYKK